MPRERLKQIMPEERLSLVETPPNRQQVRFALASSAALFAILLLVAPFADIPLIRLDGFVPMVDPIVMVADLVAATLLFAQASVLRSRSLAVLAAGYVFTAILVSAHALTFPGAFSSTGLLHAGPDTTVWIVILWWISTPLQVIAYALLKQKDARSGIKLDHPSRAIKLAICSATLAAISLVALTSAGEALLPSIMADGVRWKYYPIVTFAVVQTFLVIFAVAMMWRPERSVLDMWLFVAVVGSIVQLYINMAAEARFSLGWYVSRIVGLSAHLVVVLALLAETNRMYARLLRSVMAQRSEREGRLASMDAVAAAMAHEIRQPLTAMVTNASAALRWLDRTTPDVATTSRLLTAIVTDGHRTADVIESIRGVFAKHSGERSPFRLHELVRETASLIAGDVARQNIHLKLSLDDALPPLVADRGQIQQVLINLLTNAIESLGATRGRPRQLTIRTAPLDGEAIILEVADSGIGILPEKMPYIFEAFFTTKEKGMGMGLSLCRSIVEAHGGSLWASAGENFGATFHMQLPRTLSEGA